jgi:hypothetical protein
MAGVRRALCSVRSRVAGWFVSLSRLLRQGLLSDVQQRAQRHQNTDQQQSATVSHGTPKQATSGLSGRKKPVAIFHYPQRRHMLQRPADYEDRPGRQRGSSNHEPLRIIRGFPEGIVNGFRIAARFFAPISVRLVHLVLAPGIVRGYNRAGGGAILALTGMLTCGSPRASGRRCTSSADRFQRSSHYLRGQCVDEDERDQRQEHPPSPEVPPEMRA